MTAPTDGTFSAGTKITSQWLNGVNDHVNNLEADPHPSYLSKTEAATTYTTQADLASSAAGKGAELVEYQGATVEAALNERLPEIGTYALLRAYTGPVTAFLVRGVSNIFDGGFGVFRVDASDTTTTDNGGTVLVDASGRRWKRVYSGAVNVLWFGAKGDYNGTTGTDNTAAFAAAIAVGRKVHFPGGSYLHSGIVIDTSTQYVHLEGDGIIKTELVCKTAGVHSISINASAGQYYYFPTIRNMSITGSKSGVISGSGIYSNGAVGWLYERLRITNHGSHGIEFAGTGTITAGSNLGAVRSVTCWGNAGDGLRQIATAGSNQHNASWITNCDFSANGNGVTAWGTDITFRDCVFQGNTGYGLGLRNLLSAGPIYSATNIAVTGCYFESNGNNALYVRTGATSYGTVQFLQVENNFFFKTGSDVNYVTVKFEGGGNENEVRGLTFRQNNISGSAALTTYADFGGTLGYDCVIAPLWNASTSSANVTTTPSRYINLGNARFDFIKGTTLVGFFDAKGGANLVYSSQRRSDSITVSGANTFFPVRVPSGSSIAKFSIPVETDSTNYTVQVQWFRRGYDSTAVHTNYSNDTFSSKSGNQLLETAARVPSSGRVGYDTVDQYIKITVTLTTPGTYFYLGNPTIWTN